MKARGWLHAAAACALLLGGMLAAAGCSRGGPAPAARPATKEQVSFCQGGVLTVLPLVAREKGLFAAEGIEADLVTYGDGRLTMDAFLAGACNFATVGEPPVVQQSFQRHDFAIIASTVSTENATRILARRDRCIATPRDLKGKRIGARKGTISHFFLDVFLQKNGIRPRDVTVCYLDLKQMPLALAAGEIDAYSSSDLYYLEGVRRLGARGVTFSEPGLCYNAANLVVKRDFLASRPETVRKVLRALVAAERYAAAHPAETRQLVAAARQVAPQDIDAILRDQRHVVALERPLLLSLEDHARWMVTTGSVTAGSIPNYLRFLDTAPLEAVNPSAVTIDR